jgi:hypothetical protein
MAAAYLDWIADVIEETQIFPTEESLPYLDASIRQIAGLGPEASDEAVFRTLKERWIRHGPPGVQLLGALLRDAAYCRPDSPLRPTEGEGYFTNDQLVTLDRRSLAEDAAERSDGHV